MFCSYKIVSAYNNMIIYIVEACAMGVYHTIHTLELQRKIPLGEVSRWRGRLYELSERYGTGVYSKSKDEQEFYMYAQKGVTINLRAAVNCGFIKLTIN